MTSSTIWANYNNSLTWNKAILGWFPLLTMIIVRETSEVVIKFTQNHGDPVHRGLAKAGHHGCQEADHLIELVHLAVCPAPVLRHSAAALHNRHLGKTPKKKRQDFFTLLAIVGSPNEKKKRRLSSATNRGLEIGIKLIEDWAILNSKS